MSLNKGCSFTCSLFWAFNATFPFHNGPNIAAVLGEFCKDGFKIDLPITRRAVTTCAVAPVAIAPKSPFFPVGFKFRVFYVKSLDEFVVMVNIGEVVQLLQYKMARVIEDIHPFVVSCCC